MVQLCIVFLSLPQFSSFWNFVIPLNSNDFTKLLYMFHFVKVLIKSCLHLPVSDSNKICYYYLSYVCKFVSWKLQHIVQIQSGAIHESDRENMTSAAHLLVFPLKFNLVLDCHIPFQSDNYFSFGSFVWLILCTGLSYIPSLQLCT